MRSCARDSSRAECVRLHARAKTRALGAAIIATVCKQKHSRYGERFEKTKIVRELLAKSGKLSAGSYNRYTSNTRVKYKIVYNTYIIVIIFV